MLVWQGRNYVNGDSGQDFVRMECNQYQGMFPVTVDSGSLAHVLMNLTCKVLST